MLANANTAAHQSHAAAACQLCTATCEPAAGAQEVEDKFTKFGDVHRARIVRNTYNGESRGFGFVEMKTEDGTDRVSPSTSHACSEQCIALCIALLSHRLGSYSSLQCCMQLHMYIAGLPQLESSPTALQTSLTWFTLCAAWCVAGCCTTHLRGHLGQT